MKKKVIDAITRFSLLDGVDEVTVALSGGADSVSLLYVLCELKDELGISISAAHFNHKIRGEEADNDEAFVKSVCSELGIRLYCGSADVPKYAKENRMSTELAARELRYDFLSRVAHGAVATAHTCSDSLETLLFNLSRGTGIKGLCGIPAKRGIFIRPLIFCTRADVEEYCERHNIVFVTDSTNLKDDYMRNKIRHNAVPVLKEVNPSLEAAAMRTALSLSEDSDFLDIYAERQYALRFKKDYLDVSDFEAEHPAVAKRIIMRYYDSVCGESAEYIHTVGMYNICLSGGRVSLPGNRSAVVKNGKLRIINNSEALPDIVFSVEITEVENNFFEKDKKVNNLFLKNALDCDKIVGKLVTRTRESGDRIKLKNKNCTKTLKKLYNEYSVPLEERKYIPVISDDEGVVWICGIGVSERAAVTAESRRVLKLEVNKRKGE